MRNGVIVTTMLMAAGASQAQERPAGPDRGYAVVSIGGGATLPAREIEPPAVPTSYRDFRVDPGLHVDRSAHTRALDEMNAINNRRPRTFRFRPVMALTFDAADLDGPTRVSGIAPNLMGWKPRR
jgi:hypothetical protein